jgi:Na+/H+-dicarboxylate symporter
MNSLKDLYIHLQTLVKNRLWLKVLIGLFLGILMGVILSPNNDYMTLKTSETITNWLALPGNLFIRLVQMIMIPLIISSIIQGIAGGDNKDTLKEMGPKLGLYFLLTTLLSINLISYSLTPPPHYWAATPAATPTISLQPTTTNTPQCSLGSYSHPTSIPTPAHSRT